MEKGSEKGVEPSCLDMLVCTKHHTIQFIVQIAWIFSFFFHENFCVFQEKKKCVSAVFFLILVMYIFFFYFDIFGPTKYSLNHQN